MLKKGVWNMRKGYDFFSFFVIPALTLLLAAGYELTETNFSVIGNREGRRGLFLLWGAAAGNYFYLYVKELIEFGGCRDRLLTVCLFLSFTFFLCGVGLPYLPGKVPVLSKLHVWASFLGPFFIFLCLPPERIPADAVFILNDLAVPVNLPERALREYCAVFPGTLTGLWLKCTLLNRFFGHS